jgi:SAM-dependent methyltransferase
MVENMELDQAARVERERHFYDVKGDPRTEKRQPVPHACYFYYQKQLDIVRAVFLPRQGGAFLEIGSTTWLDWIEEAGVRPARLVCINISQREVEKGLKASENTAVKPEFCVMDAHHLDFPDHTFDAIFGGGILHHLEYEKALKEIRRVLKPGGVIVFAEPMDMNPVARLARSVNPEFRTEDETPFRMRELAICSSLFKTRFYFEQFSSVFAGGISSRLFSRQSNILTRIAFWFDEKLLALFPRLGPYYRYVLMVGE